MANVCRILTFVNVKIYILIQCFMHVLCNENGEYYLNSTGLTSVPSTIPSDAKLLDLRRNSIRSIPKEYFERFYQLEILRLGSNPLSQLPQLFHLSGTLNFVGLAPLPVRNATHSQINFPQQQLQSTN